MKEKSMMFLLGVVVGAAAFYLGEMAYEKLKKSREENSKEEEEEEDADEEVQESVASDIKAFPNNPPTNYTSFYFKEAATKIVVPSEVNDDEFKIEEGIYGISPDEFGEVDGYDTRTLTYYADGVLTDSDNSIIEDPSELVGENWKDEFGKFEDDAAYIRNDYICQDFEILKDLDKYSTWFGNKDKGDE